jgi:DNA helicase-2/ATP-dependent DNA helicase PcrA
MKNESLLTVGEIRDDNHVDDQVDEEIRECIRLGKNFFMFAGAGSGKTRSLVNALSFIANEYGDTFNMRQKQVAVITYTNAACDEINRRIGYNPLFAVSTIHSFLWELIKPYQRDIKNWVEVKLQSDIDELIQKQNNPRSRKDYSLDLRKKKDRHEALSRVSRFTYNPNSENVGRDSLDHSEVISMGSDFIREKETMQRVLVSRFPSLLIDESQDTKKELVDALLSVEQHFPDNFIIGMFGDTMQKIYTDGKDNLADSIPKNWKRPAKLMNHRSTRHVIQLANAIRTSTDGQQQQSRSDKSIGFVRLFIANNTNNKLAIETSVYSKMSEITGDELWCEQDKRKTLVLEHSMAAVRLGFATLNDKLKGEFNQSLRDGTLPELSFLMKVIYPLVQAKRNGDSFAVMKILREYSPLLNPHNFQTSDNQQSTLQIADKCLESLSDLWSEDKIPNCIDIYENLTSSGLLELPKRIEEVLNPFPESNERITALKEALKVSLDEVIRYWDYVNDNTQFSTHQGIKGLEFDRVAVIMDDESAGRFLFSYDKLFGAKPLTSTDITNEKGGKDSTPLRTVLSRVFRIFLQTGTANGLFLATFFDIPY